MLSFWCAKLNKENGIHSDYGGPVARVVTLTRESNLFVFTVNGNEQTKLKNKDAGDGLMLNITNFNKFLFGNNVTRSDF